MQQKDMALAVGMFAERVAAAAHELADVVRAATRDVSEPEEPPVAGKRQRLVVEVLVEHAAQDGRDGMKVADIDRAMGYDDPQNTLSTLRALEKRAIAELVPGQAPQRWRLTGRYARGRRVWTRDELVVAMHDYIAKAGSLRQADLEELKDKLDRIALRDGERGRTMGSIGFKLGNLRAIETDGDAGFPHYGSLDKEVWNEFADDRDGLAAAAQAILDTVD